MNIEKVLSRDKLIMVSRIKESDAGLILMDLLERERADWRVKYETKPQVNNEEVQKDFRFLLGCIFILNKIINIPEEAEKLSKKVIYDN